MASFQAFLAKFMAKKMKFNRALDDIRADLEKTNEKELRLPAGIESTRMNAGGLQGEWFASASAPQEKAIIYIHGGGYALGVYNMHRAFAARVAKETDLRVLLLNYRVGPEDIFPSALEDSGALYRWILGSNFLPEHIAYITDSSGASLAIATLCAMRDRFLAMPSCVMSFCPAIDFKRTGKSHSTMAHADPFHTKPDYFLENYYVGGMDKSNPSVSPFYADLKGLPPMKFICADIDVFADDGKLMSDKLMSSGVEASSKKWPGMIHNFQMFDTLPEGKAAIKEACEYIKGKMLP